MMTANPMSALPASTSGMAISRAARHRLSIRKSERIVICGPSGSGKSTLIRCINALEEFQEGRIVVDGIELGPNLRRVDEVRREVGMVFQSFNCSAFDRAGYCCADLGTHIPKKDAEEAANETLEHHADFAPDLVDRADWAQARCRPRRIRPS